MNLKLSSNSFCFIWANLLCLVISQQTVFGQFTLGGRVIEKNGKKALVAASMVLKPLTAPGGGMYAAQTDSKGSYRLEAIRQGAYRLECSFTGYVRLTRVVYIHSDTSIDLALSQSTLLTEELNVRATRAADRSGTVFTLVGKDKIDKENLGRDLPYLLESVPSAIASSDGGVGVGYTALRLRGADPTSINVTLNGIPYNDAESLGTYFVDVPDLASSIESIQVQRGAGTSTNGAGAFGASLNIQTESPRGIPFVSLATSAGSFGTFKTTLKAGTGLLKKGWAFEGRLSRISTNGYIERAFARLSSGFFSGAHYGKRDVLRLNVFSGKEKTYQAWTGVPEDTLPHHRRYNYFTYPNQTDNYVQTHYQALYSVSPNERLALNGALHLTHGKGYFEEYESKAAPADYGLPGLDTTNLVRRQWLDNSFEGITWSALFHPKAAEYTLGGAFSDYRGLHFGEIISTAAYVGVPSHYRYYNNTGIKSDFNGYAKGSWSLGTLRLSADLQYRSVRYRFFGLDEFRKDIAQVRNLNFFNPKFGADLRLSAASSLYLSTSVASKEPNRDDYVQALRGQTPKPEKLIDLEAGFRKRDSIFSYSAGFYYMYYVDQLVLTGKLNDVGNPVRTNVDNSYRMGLELEFSVRPAKILSWTGNLCLSRNRIASFDEVLYDGSGVVSVINHRNTPIAFSPSVTAYSTISYRLPAKLQLDIVDHYIGKRYLDDTGNETRKLHPYQLTDLRLRRTFTSRTLKEFSFSIALNNITGVTYESAGASYPFIAGGRAVNSNYYFPQAGINFLAGINVRF